MIDIASSAQKRRHSEVISPWISGYEVSSGTATRRLKRSKTDPKDGPQSTEVLNLLNRIYELSVKARSKKDHHKNHVLIRAIYDVYDKLPSEFTFKMGEIKKRGEFPIGAGNFADVWKGHWLDKTVAVKVLRMALNKKIPELEERFLKEVRIWRKLEHPNVLRFLGTAEGFSSNLAMVSPWMANGDARSYIEKHPEVDRLKLIANVCSGLEYLHSQTPPITHGDLRGANILVDEHESGYLSDFGLANIVEENTDGSFTHIMEGNCRYLAPELIEPSVLGKRGIRPSPETDMHSFGMLMLELLTGHEPYHDIKREGSVIIQVVVRNLRPTKPIVPQVEIQQLIDKMWAQMEELNSELGKPSNSIIQPMMLEDGIETTTDRFPYFSSTADHTPIQQKSEPPLRFIKGNDTVRLKKSSKRSKQTAGKSIGGRAITRSSESAEVEAEENEEEEGDSMLEALPEVRTVIIEREMGVRDPQRRENPPPSPNESNIIQGGGSREADIRVVEREVVVNKREKPREILQNYFTPLLEAVRPIHTLPPRENPLPLSASRGTRGSRRIDNADLNGPEPPTEPTSTKIEENPTLPLEDSDSLELEPAIPTLSDDFQMERVLPPDGLHYTMAPISLRAYAGGAADDLDSMAFHSDTESISTGESWGLQDERRESIQSSNAMLKPGRGDVQRPKRNFLQVEHDEEESIERWDSSNGSDGGAREDVGLPASCSTCQRVFETKDILSGHFASQGGKCNQLSLSEILASQVTEDRDACEGYS